MADETDALRRLEERLDRAAEAAERLLADAVARAAVSSDSPSSPEPASEPAPTDGGPTPSRGKPPPAGWQIPGAGGPAAGGGGSELDLLVSLWSAVRDRIPPELQKRLAEAIREVLLAVRALIDWYLERAQRPASNSSRVQDIPIL